jgi:hypothetical protein
MEFAAVMPVVELEKGRYTINLVGACQRQKRQSKRAPIAKIRI